MTKNKIVAANIVLIAACAILVLVIFMGRTNAPEIPTGDFPSVSDQSQATSENSSQETSAPSSTGGISETTESIQAATTVQEEPEPNPNVVETPAATENKGLTTDDIGVLPVPVIITINENKFDMTLVNRKYRMPDNYNIQLTPCISGSDIKLDYRVSPHYEAMYKAAKADGITLTPYSGYRSYTRQETNYNNKTQYYINEGFTKEQSRTLAARIIMPPGSSEHNLGLAMDICGTSYSFNKTKEYKWLTQNAEDYGFILRYPEDKQHITQVVYEPWHWRYVGIENAKKINASGLCLEEYLGLDAG